MSRYPLPSPLFDKVAVLQERLKLPQLTAAQNSDYKQACHFLLCYKDNQTTFTAYRREIERLLQWCYFKEGKTLKQLRRDDVDRYIRFCLKPLKSWIGLKKVARFINHNGARIGNPKWRLFVATLPKAQVSKGKNPHVDDYTLSEKSLREIFTVTSSFFNFLIQEDHVSINPFSQIRQKNKYFTKQQTKRIVRKLPELQWGYVIETAHLMAEKDAAHERTLFIMNTLYGMYLRISELVSSRRWSPPDGTFLS